MGLVDSAGFPSANVPEAPKPPKKSKPVVEAAAEVVVEEVTE